MKLLGFDFQKGIFKFLLGAISAGIAIVVQNPALLTKYIPEKIATMTIAGLVLEALDFLHHKFSGK